MQSLVQGVHAGKHRLLVVVVVVVSGDGDGGGGGDVPGG